MVSKSKYTKKSMDMMEIAYMALIGYNKAIVNKQ